MKDYNVRDNLLKMIICNPTIEALFLYAPDRNIAHNRHDTELFYKLMTWYKYFETALTT